MTLLDRSRFVPPPRVMRGLRTAAMLGGLSFVFGLFVAPERAWGGYLMGLVYFTGMALAGGLFLSVMTLANARWAIALRRIPEAMTSALPAAFVMGVVLLAGVHSLYEWSHASVVAEDPILAGKAAYLDRWFFSLRLIAFFGLWIWSTRKMVGASRRQDEVGDPDRGRRRWMWSALFLPIFAITFSLASVDWLQSLEPHWFSTIFGLVTLSGLGTSGLAVCILLAVFLRRGPLRGVISRDHLDDLGKIAVGFALFWGYIWYCQYMLIWYTDMPEETPYYVLRSQGGWNVLSTANLLVNWAVPFFALMPRAARRSELMLQRVAWVMLAGQALNLYMMVEPALLGGEPAVGLWELGPLVGALALFLWLVLRGLARAPLVPWRDPELAASLRHHC